MTIDQIFIAGKEYDGILHIGHIEIFVNLPLKLEHDITTTEIDQIETQVRGRMAEAIAAAGLREQLRIQDSRSKRGCVIVTLFFGVLATAAVVKEYASLRESVILMANDIQKVSVSIKGLLFEKSSFVKSVKIEPTITVSEPREKSHTNR